MTIYHTPYTYLIGWSNHNTYYYGVRYARDCQPSDLWESYFTSSNHVSEFRKQHGDPDIIQIRKTFTDASRARDWEDKVINRLKLHRREDFLNKNRSKGFDLSPEYFEEMKRVRNTPEWKAKASAQRKGIKHSAEARKNMAIAAKKRGATCVSHTEDTKKKMSENALTHNPGFSASSTCPKCGKQGQKANISKWHGLEGEKCRW